MKFTKLLALLLAIVMLMSLALVSCKKDEDEGSGNGGEGSGTGTSVFDPAPDLFYYNLVTNNGDLNQIAVVVNQISFSTEYEDIEIGLSELFLSFNDGELYGYGNVDITSVDSEYNETHIVKGAAVIDDYTLYVSATNETDDGDMSIVIEYSLYTLPEFEMILSYVEMIPELTEWLKTELLPLFTVVLENNKSAIDKALSTFFNLFLTVEASGDNYTLSLDIDKLIHLNDQLYKLTVSEFVDYVLGSGTYDSLDDKLFAILDMTIADVIEWVEGKGLDIDAVIDTVFELLTEELDMGEDMLGDINAETIKGYLDMPELSEITIGDLLISLTSSSSDSNVATPEISVGDASELSSESGIDISEIKASITEGLTTAKDLKFYEAITGDADSAKQIKEQVDSTLTLIKNSVSLTVVTTKNSEFKSLEVNITNLFGVNADVEIKTEHTSSYDYDKLVSDVTSSVDSITHDISIEEITAYLSDEYSDYVFSYDAETDYIHAEYVSYYYYCSSSVYEDLAEGETTTITGYLEQSIYIYNRNSHTSAPVIILDEGDGSLYVNLSFNCSEQYYNGYATIVIDHTGAVVSAEFEDMNEPYEYNGTSSLSFYIEKTA